MCNCKIILSYIVLSVIAMVNSIDIKDLQSLFQDNNCLKASLIPIFPSVNEPTVIDSNLPQEVIIDQTIKFDQAVTIKINELAQYNKIDFEYELISEEGPPHAKTFTVTLKLGNEKYEGTSSSLKKAKQAAANLALENTSYEHPPEKIKEHSQMQTPTVVLNNIGVKVGIAVSYYLLNGKEEHSIDSYSASEVPFGNLKSYFDKVNSTSGFLRVPSEESQISGPFSVKVKFGDFAFIGIGHSIQAARHDAASKAIKYLEKEALLKNNVCMSEDSVEECKKAKENLKSPITRVYEAAQKHNLFLEFNIVSESGKPHQKVYVTECKLGDFITEGTGSSKKESKKLAAENMLVYLSYFPENYNENTIVGALTNNQKKRKKKNKINRKIENNLISTVSQMTASLWEDTNSDKSDSLSQKKSKTSPSAKNKILEIANKLNFHVDFTDLNKRDDEFYSLMSLEVKPPHLCLGTGNTRDLSHEAAASHGLKFLWESGIFKTSLDDKKYKREDLTEYFDIIDENLNAWVEDTEKNS